MIKNNSLQKNVEENTQTSNEKRLKTIFAKETLNVRAMLIYGGGGDQTNHQCQVKILYIMLGILLKTCNY